MTPEQNLRQIGRVRNHQLHARLRVAQLDRHLTDARRDRLLKRLNNPPMVWPSGS